MGQRTQVMRLLVGLCCLVVAVVVGRPLYYLMLDRLGSVRYTLPIWQQPLPVAVVQPAAANGTAAAPSPATKPTPQPKMKIIVPGSEAVQLAVGKSKVEDAEDLFAKGYVLPRPKNTPLPPMQEFSLSRELIAKHANERKDILVTFANLAYKDFVLNWVSQLKQLHVHNFIVGALHDELLEDLYKLDIPCFAMHSKLSTQDFGWGTLEFHKSQRQKASVDLVRAFVEMGFNIFFSDVDVVWYQDPLQYVTRYPTADVLISSDHLSSTSKNGSLEEYQAAYAAAAYSTMNVGIMYVRAVDPCKNLLKQWSQTVNTDPNYWDQAAFNDIIKQGMAPLPATEQGTEQNVFMAYKQQLKMGILPVGTFCNGHTYFVQGMPGKLGLQPYAAHATFQFGGTEGKRHRIREDKHWIDDQAYHNPTGGLLVYNPDIPGELLHEGPHTFETHFKLVNYQLTQIRTAFAFATALGRTMVMPELWCRVDRYWAPHDGMIPGSRIDQPFRCPLDHVFEIPNLLRPLPESEYGPNIPFREYSFFSNPRTPLKVKSSRVEVLVCDDDSDCKQLAAAAKGAGRAQARVVPHNMTDVQAKEAFGHLTDIAVLQFMSMKPSHFAGFVDQDAASKFRRRMKEYTSIWCCVQPKPNLPGHIWYDIYHDQKPGWKPLPPQDRNSDRRPD
eukprot:jgi/Chlat1/2197/Chrsp17S02758